MERLKTTVCIAMIQLLWTVMISVTSLTPMVMRTTVWWAWKRSNLW